MADEQVITDEKIAAVDNQLGAGIWGEKSADGNQEVKADQSGNTENSGNAADKIDETNSAKDATFNESDYLKTNYGYENSESLKKELIEIKELREKAKTPAEIKFANEESKKFFSYFTEEGKEEELLSHLQTKKLIEKAEKANIENPKEATELLQTYYKFKYKDFDDNEVKDHFNDQYAKPSKPKQTDDIEDPEYKEMVKEWETKCEVIDKRIIRDAKMVKPEFSQFKTQVVLPDIQKPSQSATKQPTQEELEVAKKAVDEFIQSVDTDLKTLNDFSLTYKDEAVEIPLSYGLTAEEKTAVSDQLKAFAESNFDANAIFASKWVNKDKSLNVSRMTRDLAYLNSQDKIAQKFVDDAVGKRMDKYTKDKKNIHLNGGNGQSQNGGLGKEKALEAVEEALWNGKR